MVNLVEGCPLSMFDEDWWHKMQPVISQVGNGVI